MYADTDFEPEVRAAWEILPSPSGHPHLVDPDPDAMFESYPVSLCGTMLFAKNGKIENGTAVCPTCLEIAAEREGEA